MTREQYEAGVERMPRVHLRRRRLPGRAQPALQHAGRRLAVLRLPRLRAVNPSPYLYYIAFDDFALCGSSPEPLVTVQGSRVETRPDRRHAPAGRDAAEDRRLMDDLRADEKERAEHVMLVDLGRNDLGRVCAPGTVKVDELMEMELYSHVIHMVSTVSGTLRRGDDAHRRAQGGLPGRHRHRRPQGPRHADHRRARDRAARPLRRRHRLPQLRRRPRHLHLHPHRARQGRHGLRAGRRRHRRRLRARRTEYEETQNKAAALLRAIDLAHEQFGDGGTCMTPSSSPARRRRPGLHDRQLRLVHLQPRAVPRRAGRRGRPWSATTASPSPRSRRPSRRTSSSRPGPCTPNEAGISHGRHRALRRRARAGARRVPRPPGASARSTAASCAAPARPVHGKTDQIDHDGARLFAGLPDPFTATRYHSLVVDERAARLPRAQRLERRTAS